ncbi:MAG: NADH-quinone oxidoreductase subunit NuoE [Polyangiaceae bacterium]|nr:NADH-quinone oxidoreductase subunit NuoE [Polyangiaceae bacterium]
MTMSEEVRLEPILAEFPDAARDALIPILQRVQEAEGYLSEVAIARIGRHLNLPASKVFGVATFYNQFRFLPKGKYHVMICRGTACHVKGSVKLLDVLTRTLKVRPGQTSRDGLFSLEVVACMGACGLAPAMSVNGEVYAKMTPKRIEKVVAECRAKEQA